MATLFGIVSILASIVGFVCAIMMVIEMYGKKGLVHAILGCICGLYLFIWGWMNAQEQKTKMVMIVWTVSIIVNLIASGAGAAFGSGQ